MKSISCILGRVSMIFVFSIAICLIGNPFNVTAAVTESFTITSADNSANSSTWDLKYSESENAFKITMSEIKGEREYTVRSKFFEIAYVVNKNGFGARMIKAGNAQVAAQILSQILNQNELGNQKVISSDQVDNATALNLIASYLPDLINTNYKHLLQ